MYPVYIEISPYGGCNHRCVFCAFDFLGYKPAALETGCLKKFIKQASRNGVKAVLYSGEGEPLLHKDIADIIVTTKRNGIDTALVTNGVMLDVKKARAILGYLSWLKVSVDAGTPETYAVVHRTAKQDFKTVLRNLKDAVAIRNKEGYACTIGVQYLLIPQNCKEVETAVRAFRDIGVDYVVIKPYSPHFSSKQRVSSSFRYSRLFYLEKKVEKYSDSRFSVIFRHRAMQKLEEQEKPYLQCLGMSFAACIAADGYVYPCHAFLGNRKHAFGNIGEDSFAAIWKGAARKKITDAINSKGSVRRCRKACRLDEINRYLWELKNPDGHVNFI